MHVNESKLLKKFQPKQQKERRIPINLQERVNNEVKKLLREGHKEKVLNCLHQFFKSPVVITVKGDQTIKIVLDSKVLNKSSTKTSTRYLRLNMN